MISPSKGRYEMLLLQPVGPSLPMTTYIQVNRRTTAHCKAQQCEPEKSMERKRLGIIFFIFFSTLWCDMNWNIFPKTNFESYHTSIKLIELEGRIVSSSPISSWYFWGPFLSQKMIKLKFWNEYIWKMYIHQYRLIRLQQII